MKDSRHGTGGLRLGESAEVLAELVSQRTVAQELVQSGSQGVGEGRGRFDHEGGGVVGEQAGVEPLMIVSRGRQRDENRWQAGTRQLGQRRRSGSRDDERRAAIRSGHVRDERLHVGVE